MSQVSQAKEVALDMDGSGNMQNQRWAVAAGILALFYILNKLRGRRKMKKMVEERLKARMEEAREKSVSGRVRRRLVEETKSRKKSRKKGKQERSMLRTLIRAVAFQLAKKIISEQINRAEIGLKGLKAGKKAEART